MIGRSAILALAALALLGGRAAAQRAPLCERLFVPEGYALDCSVRGGAGAGVAGSSRCIRSKARSRR